MKIRSPLLLALALLGACASPPTPLGLDPQSGASTESDQDAQARARAALDDIQKRAMNGDLPKIRFAFDSAALDPSSYKTLNLIAQVVLSNSHLKIFILAHCDSVGTAAYNLDLSQRRAKSVSDYLASVGVPPPSIRYKGYGSSLPIADNSTEEGRAKNRRVEFRITTRDWKSVY